MGDFILCQLKGKEREDGMMTAEDVESGARLGKGRRSRVLTARNAPPSTDDSGTTNSKAHIYLHHARDGHTGLPDACFQRHRLRFAVKLADTLDRHVQSPAVLELPLSRRRF